MHFGSVLLVNHNTGLLQEHSKINFRKLVTGVDAKAVSARVRTRADTHTHTHCVCS